ncbi:MAG: hypothetical protein ACI8RD_012770 [Bacillariaceae sp.]|jgi:hypothetical protein
MIFVDCSHIEIRNCHLSFLFMRGIGEFISA